MNMANEIVLEVWGDFACFTRPESKVERLTYPVPTPSAMRGVLSAIYSKPPEFYWQVNRIEVLNPLKYISFKRNEVKGKLSERAETPILADGTKDITGTDQKGRTQRQTVALKDVRYRVYASICKRESCDVPEEELVKQALRRIRNGKCFYQPSLGLREFVAYYEESDSTRKPIDLNLDLGYMLYDVFDLHSFKVTKKANPYVTLFHAVLQGGVLEVPPYDSDAVLKPEVR
jgi:CRISPR-associated protein Cas5d